MDLRRQIALVRTWYPLLLASVLLAAGAAFAVSSLQPKVYEARATLIVGQSLTGVNPNYEQLLTSQRLSTTYAAVATTRPMLEAVIDELGLDQTPDEMKALVKANAPADSTLITITVQDTDPERAAATANALAAQLIAASPAIQGRQADLQKSIEADLKATQVQIEATQARLEALTSIERRTAAQEAELATLEGRLVSLRSTYATLLSFSSGSSSNLISVIEPAVPPTSPISPRPLMNALLAALIGLVVALGVAWVVEYFNETIKDPDDVQAVFGLSTLGTITRMKGDGGRSEIYQLATLLYPRSSVAEGYRTLRANIEFSSVDAPIQTLLVSSAMPGEGKTVTAANLAVAFAQAGRRVLLIDADLRKPGVHLLFGLPNFHGLTTLLRRSESTIETVAQRTEQDNLRVVTTGPLPPNPAELLGSQRMRAVLNLLQGQFDLLVFDSPPLQAVADASILSSFVDGTILVIDATKSRRRPVRHARETLERAGAHLLGAVLNRVSAKAREGYSDYYGDVYGGETPVEKLPGGSEGVPERSAP